jgi:peptidoglycan/xylan/chitin deacetylase (PgdA/CDA1 family)
MRVALFLLIIFLVTNGGRGYAAPANVDGDPTKRIALSFDDAPKSNGPRFSGDERTAILIDVLESVEAGPAVFFIKTSNFQRPGGRERVARYADAGHLIANHTHSHSWLKQTDTHQYIEDIDLAEELLQGFPNRRAWFRFPFLDEGIPRAKRDAVRTALNERGLMNGYVTIDNYDWYLDTKWKAAVDEGRSVDIEALRGVYVEMLMGAVTFFHDMAVESLKQSPAHVLLLHENDVAAMFVGDLVTALRAEGWVIVSPDEAYADPIASVVPRTLMTQQGHIAALAVDAGLDPRTLTHLAIEEDQIDALLSERNVFGE